MWKVEVYFDHPETPPREPTSPFSVRNGRSAFPVFLGLRRWVLKGPIRCKPRFPREGNVPHLAFCILLWTCAHSLTSTRKRECGPEAVGQRSSTRLLTSTSAPNPKCSMIDSFRLIQMVNRPKDLAPLTSQVLEETKAISEADNSSASGAS